MNNKQRKLHDQIRAMSCAALLATLWAAGPAAAEDARQGVPAEAGLEPFLGEPAFDVQPVFEGERLPNVVVATDGTVRATWGWGTMRVRRSDDGGKTWRPSAPFPALGTGEATLAELADGRIYYNSRRHLSTDGRNPRMRHIAHSDDGGATWKDLSVSEVLPDGDQHRDYGLMAGLVRLPVRGRDILIFSNIVSARGRHNGHVWASFDGGQTWPVKRQVDEGSFAYSSLAAGRPATPSEGWIYLLYEGSGGGRIVRFKLAWLLEGEPTGDGDVPDLVGW